MRAHYKYHSPIGEGGFCIVSKYTDVRSNSLVAIKLLKKEHFDNFDYKHRFGREIRLLKVLGGHPNIINLLDSEIDEASHSYWYAMPMATTNLFTYIRRNNQSLSLANRIDIFDQILAAVKHSHNRKILHRDLGPSNVLIFMDGPKPRAIVCDFGLGKNTESQSYATQTSLASHGQILYVSSRQRESLRKATFSDDIYSLGMLLYFTMTGKDPINLKTCDFSIPIAAATEETAEKGLISIDQFEAIYLRTKRLLTQTSPPMAQETLSEYLQSTEQMDWIRFHQLALLGNSPNHIYHDYVEPTIALFKNPENFRQYHLAVGASITEFVRTFILKLHECYGTTRWPFSAMDNFGNFLHTIYTQVEANEVKLACLKEIWSLAYDANQWAVQRLLARIFNSTSVPNDLLPQFAYHVLESDVKIKLSDFAGVRLPPMVRTAIAELEQKHSNPA